MVLNRTNVAPQICADVSKLGSTCNEVYLQGKGQILPQSLEYFLI